jgi:hypothetical protein
MIPPNLQDKKCTEMSLLLWQKLNILPISEGDKNEDRKNDVEKC